MVSSTCGVYQSKNEHSSLARIWMVTTYKSYSKNFLIQNNAQIDLTKSNFATSFMGCNQLQIQYRIVNDSTMNIISAVGTEKACNGMNLETNFLKDCLEIEHYTIEGHKLILTGANQHKMEFIAQDWD